MYTLRVFNQLIYNADDNLTNVMISPDWHLWMIDFTRAFRTQKNIAEVKNLVQCDRKMLAKMKELNKEVLKEKMHRYLTGGEIDGLLARRDKIVKFFEDEVAKKGEAAVMFDLKPPASRPRQLQIALRCPLLAHALDEVPPHYSFHFQPLIGEHQLFDGHVGAFDVQISKLYFAGQARSNFQVRTTALRSSDRRALFYSIVVCRRPHIAS